MSQKVEDCRSAIEDFGMLDKVMVCLSAERIPTASRYFDELSTACPDRF